jgi:acyl-CoA synthetase (AMP-forming)/AMP-acid ligase II
VNLGLSETLAEHVRSRPEGVAVVCGADRLSYAVLADRIGRLAAVIEGLGVGHGDRVLWLGQNCHRLLELFLACAETGASLCPANWRQTSEELSALLDDLDPDLVVWQDRELGDRISFDDLRSRSRAAWLQHDGVADDSYEARLEEMAPRPLARGNSPDLPSLILYTAAVDGRPNGAILTAGNLLIQSLVVANLKRIDSHFVHLNCGPLYHIATWLTLMPTFQQGGTNVFVSRVDPYLICQLIESEGCNEAFLLPPTIEEIVSANRIGRWNLKTLRTSWFRTPDWGAMTSADHSPMGQAPGGYGQTELVGLATFAALGGRPGDTTSGRPSPVVEVRIVDETDNDVPTAGVGEIVVRGATVTPGYHNRPDLNAARLRNGWWHTGDLGRRERDGIVTFIGPKSRIIKSAAENIYPAEVEACIETHPGVAEAAVIGIPDSRWGQAVRAIVTVASGAILSQEEVIGHCRRLIASYKKPRDVIFVAELPRRNGAKDYDELDRLFGGGGYPGAGATVE